MFVQKSKLFLIITALIALQPFIVLPENGFYVFFGLIKKKQADRKKAASLFF